MNTKVTAKLVALLTLLSLPMTSTLAAPRGDQLGPSKPGTQPTFRPGLTTPKTDVTIMIQKLSCDASYLQIKVRAQNTTSSPTIPTNIPLNAKVTLRHANWPAEQLIANANNPHTVPQPLWGGHTWHVNGPKPSMPGRYLIKAYIDYDYKLPETNEGNNVVGKWVSCP